MFYLVGFILQRIIRRTPVEDRITLRCIDNNFPALPWELDKIIVFFAKNSGKYQSQLNEK